MCGVMRSDRDKRALCTSGKVNVALLRISSVIPDHLQIRKVDLASQSLHGSEQAKLTGSYNR